MRKIFTVLLVPAAVIAFAASASAAPTQPPQGTRVGGLLVTSIIQLTTPISVTAGIPALASGIVASRRIPQSGTLCSTFEPDHNCLGTDDFNDGTAVVERRPGRSMEYVGSTGQLHFTAANPCRTAGENVSDGHVVVKNCSNTSGIAWTEVLDQNGHAQFINTYLTNHFGFDEYLSGFDTYGNAWFADSSGCGGLGCYQKFDFT